MEGLEKGELSSDLTEISKVPKPSVAGKIISWSIPIVLITIIVLVGVFKGFDKGLTEFVLWASINAASTLVFSILSLAHPLNWLVSAVAAPIAVLNPAIGVGVFTGIVEATMRKPAVKDFENLSDDISKFKGWFKNRVLHAFLIFFTTSIGSILGTFVLYPTLRTTLYPYAQQLVEKIIG